MPPLPRDDGHQARPIDLPAMAAIIEALGRVPDVEPWDDVFEITAMTVLAALRALPVAQRMEAMGMERVGRYESISSDDLPWREALNG